MGLGLGGVSEASGGEEKGAPQKVCNRKKEVKVTEESGYLLFL